MKSKTKAKLAVMAKPSYYVPVILINGTIYGLLCLLTKSFWQPSYIIGSLLGIVLVFFINKAPNHYDIKIDNHYFNDAIRHPLKEAFESCKDLIVHETSEADAKRIISNLEDVIKRLEKL